MPQKNGKNQGYLFGLMGRNGSHFPTEKLLIARTVMAALTHLPFSRWDSKFWTRVSKILIFIFTFKIESNLVYNSCDLVVAVLWLAESALDQEILGSVLAPSKFFIENLSV